MIQREDLNILETAWEAISVFRSGTHENSSKMSLLHPGYLFMYPGVTWCLNFSPSPPELGWALLYPLSNTHMRNRGILRNHQIETRLAVANTQRLVSSRMYFYMARIWLCTAG
jgi:hypothetical protein